MNTAFLVRKQYVDEISPLKSTHLVKRWRLEPSDKAAFKRGEKVEPKKPIVFYIDTLMPVLSLETTQLLFVSVVWEHFPVQVMIHYF